MNNLPNVLCIFVFADNANVWPYGTYSRLAVVYTLIYILSIDGKKKLDSRSGI